MGHGQLAAAGGRSQHGFRPRQAHVPGTVLAGWGLVVLILCAAFSAIGLGGTDSSGVLFFGMFAGIGMISYGVYRGVGGFGTPGGTPDNAADPRD